MEELAKENRLLKELAATLEKQNQSRNRENGVLIQQLDATLQQNRELRKNKQESNKQMQQMQQTLAYFKAENGKHTKSTDQPDLQEYRREKAVLQGKVRELEAGLVNHQQNMAKVQQLEEKILIVQSSKDREIDQIKAENERNLQNLIQQRILGLRQALIAELQQHHRTEIIKIRTENSNSEQLTRQINRLKQHIKSLQQHKSNIDSSQIRHLQSNNEELRNLRVLDQRENEQMKNKIRELQTELIDKNVELASRENAQRNVQEHQTKIQQKIQENEQLCAIIQTLERNNSLSAGRITELEMENESLQSEIQRKQQDKLSLQREMHELSQMNRMLMQQSGNQNNRRAELEAMMQENGKLMKIIQKLVQENQEIKSRIKGSATREMQYFEVQRQSPEWTHMHDKTQNSNDLVGLVQELRQELNIVKRDFRAAGGSRARAQDVEKERAGSYLKQWDSAANSHHYRRNPEQLNPQDYPNHHNNLNNDFSQAFSSEIRNNNKPQLKQSIPSRKLTHTGSIEQDPRTIIKIRSPTHHNINSPDGDITDKMRQDEKIKKWVTLQKKINQLQQENQQLKKNLHQ